ncbi:MAG: ABC transporter ATP-binding protein [Patescibacteria group bacterium]|jgi:ABC-2 type transport system ATP-binding protein
MAILEVRNLTKKFGTFKAVDSISFSLKEGEILGFLGPNGAGKTTTIQMLLGVLTPTSGSITYFNKNILTYREEVLERVNFSSTYTNLPWRLTVKENLTFISYLYDIQDRNKRLMKIINAFKLHKLLDKNMNQLSAGQLTRVNLAKAFVNFPRVLLLDEPTASLDPDVAAYIHEFLLKQRLEFNVSIVFTSHNMAEIEEVCDRVVFLEKGKIIADDTPENLSKTMEVSRVKLLINDGMKRLCQLCNRENITYQIDRRYITVEIKEREIPKFLKKVMNKGIFYDEISIIKPTLKDYFLHVANRGSI